MSRYEKILVGIISALSVAGVISVFDKALLAALVFAVFLWSATILFFLKRAMLSRALFLLFTIVFVSNIAMVAGMHYTHFQPFANGAGDFVEYHANGLEMYHRLQGGNFNVTGLDRASHYYPVLLGYFYIILVPSMLVGQLFNAWLIALIVLLAYFLALKIGASKKGALLVAIMVSGYPSLLFFGGLLLKDAIICFLSLLGLLLAIKLVERFTYSLFLIFYIALGLLLHFRFYIAFALMFTFILYWFLYVKKPLKQRIISGLCIIVLLGFLPQLFVVDDTGYWGIKLFKQYVNQKTITYYREEAYAPQAKYVVMPELANDGDLSPDSVVSVDSTALIIDTGEDTAGSTFMVKTEFGSIGKFIKNYTLSFVYTILGPFFWQVKYTRQWLSFIEVIPWYIALFFIIRGVAVNFKSYYLKSHRLFFPLVLFSLIVFASIALFMNNFGIIARIRIPAVICLLCFLPLALKEGNIIYTSMEKCYAYITKKWTIK